jgi:acetyl-CoA carboxylase carboxyl transferase subunit beta
VDLLLKDLFKTKPKYITVKTEHDFSRKVEIEKKDIPDGLWVKCNRCSQITYHKDIEKNFKVCPKCEFHFRIGAKERLELLSDENSFQEIAANLKSVNPLNFPDYENKIKKSQKATNLVEGAIIGQTFIEGCSAVLAIIDFGFLGGSMGSVVGEKITRAIEFAAEHQLPFVAVSGGGGGARMHEGILSLMQMAKTSQALNKLSESRSLYISVLTDPTMGGIFASFASLGDIIIAEPDALIGFAGPRVIQQTIHQTLPAGFQTSEFLLEHGIIDLIIPRKDLKSTIGRLLKLHAKVGENVGK